ncbi:MAG TPA: M56 family metallopeptidase, partial [Phycisphaerae bacterium]|nr:M56 family metallopeptidase [Phycisphaerae bacterium]
MSVSSSILSAIDLESASVLLIRWIGLSLLYGTLLALVTWLMMKLAFRRVGLAFGAVIWSIVLLKFMIPTGPGFSFSLASITQRLSPLPASNAALSAGASVSSADDVRFVTIFEQGAASADTAAAVAPLPATTLSWTVWAALGYFGIVAVLALVRARGYSRIVFQCRRLPEAPAETVGLVRQTCLRHGVARGPQVRVSDEAAAPFVVGLFRPILVLSPRHLNDAGEAEAVVLHEMAHLRPFDVFVRCLQCLVGTLLFFWPVVAWVNRRIDLAREHACDDWALSHGKLTAVEYARCLLRAMQPVRSRWSLYRPAAMAANRRHVERRIEMILDHPRYKSHARKLGVGALVVVAGWAVFALSGSSAVDAAVAPADPAAPSSGEAKVIVTKVAQAGDGEMEVRVIQLDGGDMKVKVLGAGADTDVTLPMEQIKARAMAFVAAEGGPECVMAGSFARVDEETLAQFKNDHPAADLNANGELASNERDAYLTALATLAPVAVMNQYPT